MAIERLSGPGGEAWSQYSADHLPRYHFATAYAKDKIVLDAGTGIGYGAAILKAAGSSRVDATCSRPQRDRTPRLV